MILSKHKNGYYYVYYFNEQNVRKSITTKCKIKSEALKFLSSFEKELELRRQQKLADVPFTNYCEQFLRFSLVNHTSKTTIGYKAAIAFVKKYLGETPIKSITASKMNQYFENRLETSSVYQARKDLICMKSLFNRAMSEGIILKNPCNEIKPFRLPEKQPLFLTEIELEILEKNIDNKDIRDIVVFASQTGFRQMELITLQWNQIDFKQGLAILNNQSHLTKSKKVRSIPLSLKAQQVLTQRQINNTSNLVFTYNNKTFNPDYLSRRFKKYIIDSNFNSKLKFHDLRHSFASNLVRKGVPLFTVSKLLGHSKVSVSEIYSHIQADDLRSAINKLNETGSSN